MSAAGCGVATTDEGIAVGAAANGTMGCGAVGPCMSSEIFGASARPNVTEKPSPQTTMRIGIQGSSLRAAGRTDEGAATCESIPGAAGCAIGAVSETAAGSVSFSAVARREEIATTLL